MTRMRAAFSALEEAVAAGASRRYGTATWTGYRVDQTIPAPSLSDLVAAAQDAGGAEHHFKVIQLP